jgi:hypothetical protein
MTILAYFDKPMRVGSGGFAPPQKCFFLEGRKMVHYVAFWTYNLFCQKILNLPLKFYIWWPIGHLMLKPTLRAAHHKPLTILSHISLY